MLQCVLCLWCYLVCAAATTSFQTALHPGLPLATRPRRAELGRLVIAVLPWVAVLPHASVRPAGGRLRRLQLLHCLGAGASLPSSSNKSLGNKVSAALCVCHGCDPVDVRSEQQDARAWVALKCWDLAASPRGIGPALRLCCHHLA